MTGTGTLSVTLLDVNDNHPCFAENYDGAWVAKTAMTGDTVLEFSATDPDTPANGPPFSYEMKCDNRPECDDFRVESTGDGKFDKVISLPNPFSVSRIVFKLASFLFLLAKLI